MAETYSGAVDRGLEGVVACTTGISSIVDATLCYNGYTIEDLSANSNFEETVFLLWNNHLPNKAEVQSFNETLRSKTVLSSELIEYLKKLPTKNVHPMAWLRTAVSIMALWEDESELVSDEGQKAAGLGLVAKMGSLVSLFSRVRQGLEPIAPNPEKSIAWNFLYTLKGEEPKETLVKIFDTCLILHADHELNCSAFSARVTASSLSDLYSAVVSAIGTLKGPLHGGANEQVMRMLKEIGEENKAQEWVTQALAEKKKIMGFGHRVYKNGDPRAKILRTMSEKLSHETGNSNWYKISSIIENTVKSEKGLLPNVDFYSASVYYSMGIELDLFTPIFATSRVSGWLAHIFEQYSKNRIYRPRGEWIGNEGLKWKPVSDR